MLKKNLLKLNFLFLVLDYDLLNRYNYNKLYRIINTFEHNRCMSFAMILFVHINYYFLIVWILMIFEVHLMYLLIHLYHLLEIDYLPL